MERQAFDRALALFRHARAAAWLAIASSRGPPVKDRQAFDRAPGFSRPARAASWLPIAFSLIPSVLFVALLGLLSLFAALVVHRGEIPALVQLSLPDRVSANARLELPT